MTDIVRPKRWTIKDSEHDGEELKVTTAQADRLYRARLIHPGDDCTALLGDGVTWADVERVIGSGREA